MTHSFTFKVTGATAWEVDKHATEQANIYAQGGAFGILSIHAHPFVQTADGGIALWKATVEAVVPG